MQRTVIGSLLMAAMTLGVAALAPLDAQASRPFTKVTQIECAKCHSSADEARMNERDLTRCGKESLRTLLRKGYKRGKTEAEQTQNAERYLRGFKCD